MTAFDKIVIQLKMTEIELDHLNEVLKEEFNEGDFLLPEELSYESLVFLGMKNLEESIVNGFDYYQIVIIED
jgi:hypothetical protein